jgi:hypothetical protein
LSLLQEISIYTGLRPNGTPLTELFDRIYQQHGAQLALTQIERAGLAAFMANIIPTPTRRVYLSDIKSWCSCEHVVKPAPRRRLRPRRQATTDRAADKGPAAEGLP